MPISLDGAFGIHEQAVLLRSNRAELLSSNIANADTPNYKARDFDIQAALAQLQKQQASAQANANGGPAQPTTLRGEDALMKYRIPLQSTLDGNTVDVQREQVEFSENAVRYQASVRFLDGKIKSLLTAIKGE